MPWNEVSAVDLRREFVSLAGSEEAKILNVSTHARLAWCG